MKTIAIVGLGNIGSRYVTTRHNIGFQCLSVLGDLLCNPVQNFQDFASTCNFSFDLEEKLCKKKQNTLVTWNHNKSLECMVGSIGIKDFVAILENHALLLAQFKFLKKIVKLDSKEKNFGTCNDAEQVLQNKCVEVFLQKAKNLSSDYQVLLIAPTTFMNRSGESLKKIYQYYNVVQTIIIYDDLDTRFGSLNFRFKGGSGGHNGLKSIHQHATQDYLRVKLGIGANIFFNEHALSSFCADGAIRQDLYEVFCNTLREKIGFNSCFKTQSFFKVMLSQLATLNISQETFNEIIKHFHAYHKGDGHEIANYVLSTFNMREREMLPHILVYTAFLLVGIILEWVDKDMRACPQSEKLEESLKAQEFMTLDSFCINFK